MDLLQPHAVKLIWAGLGTRRGGRPHRSTVDVEAAGEFELVGVDAEEGGTDDERASSDALRVRTPGS